MTLPGSYRAAPPRLLVAASLVLGAACYRHVPIEPASLASLAPGATVRVYLNAAGTAQLAPRLGPETITVDGRLDSARADGIALVVTRTTKSFGAAVAWVGERVTIPASAVAHAERRSLDRGRTATVAASTVAAAGAALAVLIGQRGSGSGTEGGGGPGGPAP